MIGQQHWGKASGSVELKLAHIVVHMIAVGLTRLTGHIADVDAHRR